jgi:ubiquinone/menaquinone biosynthesis C-methylase UbiE
MSVSKAPTGGTVQVEARESILAGGITSRAWRRILLAGAQAQVGPSKLVARARPSRSALKPRVVEYPNNLGQTVVGILDGASGDVGGTAVLIPPSWGRTKETFLPLARTIVRTFESSDEQIAVLRFDGTNRRGESYIEPESRGPGDEYLRFTFSQAVDDIRASARFLRTTLRPRSVILVTFSLASIEGRRAVADDREGLIDGWINVVGMVDLQSGLRAVSGGVDYAYGLVEGVSFGRHELVGVIADMDRTGGDALEHRLVFLEDARRDMTKVSVPVSWLHGRHDAWMDLSRVVTLMSSGDSSARRLIEIPTGHELRSSREALETFQLIAKEVGRISLGRDLRTTIPDLADISRRREAERARIPKTAFRAHLFWRDYVLGKDGYGGIRLLTATDAYRELMDAQIDLLDLRPGSRLLDLGSGTGELARSICRRGRELPLRIIEVDIVREALRQSKASVNGASRMNPSKVAADLDLQGFFLPFATESADRALASLLLSYLVSPESVVSEAMRILRPGGVLVVSSLRRDADISKIYATGIAELQEDRVLEIFGAEVAGRFESLQREFLNNASRLLDLEETGRFRFFDEAELVALLEGAGFSRVTTRAAFGDPPQAFVAAGHRPR